MFAVALAEVNQDANLFGGQRQGPGLGPHIADRGRGYDIAAIAAKRPAIARSSKSLDVVAQM